MEQLKIKLKENGIEWVGEDDEFIFLESYSTKYPDGIVEELEFSTGKKVKLSSVELTLNANANHNELPFVSNLNDIFNCGLRFDASDIHIERYIHFCLVRFRVDGNLISMFRIRPTEYQSVINKVKIKSELDISEKRLPQDGRIRIDSTEEESVELRVSIIPAIYGEKIVMRFLRNDLSHLSIKKVGLNSIQQNCLEQKLTNPSGLILLSGPTGSGKTTTLYAILKYLNKSSTNILTIEDPIEYSLPGINQVHLKEEIGLTYPRTLRAFLRQDPDIIMVGEIRDLDTAQMAIRASLTGHLVLSTIHANSTLGVVNRLVDMGIPYYQIKSSLRLAASQRLVRTYCDSCLGKGCDKCYGSGYKGRKALFEFLDAKQLDEYSNIEDLKDQSIDFVGGKMLSQINELLNTNATSKEELQPVLEEFSY